MKKTPSQSCINIHNAALNKVFEEALLRGFMHKLQVPRLENKGIATENRDDFTPLEYRVLCNRMRKW